MGDGIHRCVSQVSSAPLPRGPAARALAGAGAILMPVMMTGLFAGLLMAGHEQAGIIGIGLTLSLIAALLAPSARIDSDGAYRIGVGPLTLRRRLDASAGWQVFPGFPFSGAPYSGIGYWKPGELIPTILPGSGWLGERRRQHWLAVLRSLPESPLG